MPASPLLGQTSSPAEAGFASDLSDRLDRLIADKRAVNIHGVVVARHGKVVLERYFAGPDSRRGSPLGMVAFDAETPHDLRSVSKSIVGLLYGIALAHGKVPPPEAPLMRSFRQYADLAADPGRAKWTVHHVLSMTLGTDWDELGVPYTDPTNSEIAMDRAADRYRYVLSLPIVIEPGTRWIYSGGATALLGRMIADGTDKSLHEFARESLFDPLGLGPTEWLADAKGDAFAASGLRMRPRDLVRIGQLLLQRGEIDGTAIVPKEWIARATTGYVNCDEVRRFGYHWYMGNIGFTVPSSPRWNRSRLETFQGAYGNGGQRLWVLPAMELVVAVTAGNYDVADQWVPPTRVLREVVLASVV
ncbi:MAG: serine hydrolase domain-containing protein [Solimonas sp.]